MTPEISFDRTVITVNQDGVVHTLVEFEAPEAPAVQRPPIDVVFVIDNSGSMAGEPLHAVCEAVAQVIRHLGPDDRAGVVTFDNNAQLILPLGRHLDPSAQQRVRAIRAGGSTNLSAGWLMGSELLRTDQRDGAVRRLVVLTDGQVNEGIVDQDALATMVGGGRQIGVSTSCIGFSGHYQEELLGSLANAGGGNDYWCEGADAAARVFLGEFEGLASVVAQNVAITIHPTEAVAVVRVLNDFAVTELDDGAVRVDLGDAFGGERRSVLVAFHTRPQPIGGPVEVAKVHLTWVSTVDGFAAHEHVVPVTVTAGDSTTIDSGADPRVTEEVVLLDAAHQRREARRLADEGDFEGGMFHADLAMNLLSTLPSQATAYAQTVDEYDAISDHSWSSTHSKQAYSASRQMSRKRATQFRTETDEDQHDHH